jgi:RNA polymerase sigma-70 factor (ECF subfamily)
VGHPEGAPGPEVADAALVRRVAAGDDAALAALYDRYASVMLAIAVRILGDRREAEDLLHDVFLEVWKQAHTFDENRGSARGWLFLRMRSRALDRRKSAAFSRRSDSAPQQRADAADAPDVAADREAMRRALAQLPDAHRQALELGYYEGLSSSEIAERLGVPIGTVKSRVARALACLRELLAGKVRPQGGRA